MATTLNPSDKAADLTLSNGNLTVTKVNQAPTDIALADAATGSSVDPYWDNVVLLTGFDTYVSGSTFIEESQYAKTVTLVNNGTATEITSTAPLIGTKSLRHYNTTANCTVPDSDHWNPNGVDFTAELTVKYHAASGNDGYLSQWGGIPQAWAFWRESSKLAMRWYDSGGTIQNLYEASTWSPVVGTTYKLAFDIAAGVMRLYRDGAMVAKATGVSFRNGTDAFNIGTIGGFGLPADAWIDEVRITQGTARYASDAGYTPISIAFPRDGDWVTGMTVREDTPVGKVLFTIIGTDPDPGESATLTFSEFADPDNKFTVSGTTVTLSAALNYGVAASHALTIRATDIHGATYDEMFTILVGDV